MITNQNAGNLTTSLSSLAMLSLRMREGKDYLDYLEGFVLDVVAQLRPDPFDATTIQRSVEQEFGIKIPAATFALYLKRLVRPGIIRPTPDGLQYVAVNLPPTNVSADREAVTGRIRAVTIRLKEYAKTKYGQEWAEENCAAALADFLRDYSIEFVRFSEFRSPLPEAQGDSKQAQYIVASFIKNCADAEPGLFDCVKTLVQSHILANALLCPDLRDASHGFKNVNFVVDTRLLLKALDLESTYDTDNARHLLDTIRLLKGSLCVFPETKDEVRTVLKAIIRGFQNGTARGPVPTELRKRGRGMADVIIAESQLEERLKSIRISTLQSPSYEESNYRFQIDEDLLRAEIEEKLGHVPGKALEHDVRAVRNIFALRKGRRVSRIEDAGFVFLTTNAALSRAAFNYERNNSDGWIFSAVVTDYHLSHLAWLKAPVDAGDLSRSEILASCYAAMRPRESFWGQYVAELERLKKEGKVTEHDHEVLRFSLNAADELMEVTRGEVDGINERTLHAILEKLEKTYAAEKETALRKERAEHEETRRAYEASEAEAKRIAAEARRIVEEGRRIVESEQNLRLEKSDAEARILALEEARRAEEKRAEQRKDQVDVLSRRIANAAFCVVGLACAAVALLSVFSYLNLWYGVPAAILSVVTVVSGLSGNTVKRWVQKWVKKKVRKFVE
jgi:murein DD-endopeptidase MepM/ murein hydrolase activator NlpD